jgi:hypothetical protein
LMNRRRGRGHADRAAICCVSSPGPPLFLCLAGRSPWLGAKT